LSVVYLTTTPVLQQPLLFPSYMCKMTGNRLRWLQAHISRGMKSKTSAFQ
jgi:hypothetical protein